MCELLWSDPQPLPGRGPSKRGVGLSFGGDVTKRFLQENNLGILLLLDNAFLCPPLPTLKAHTCPRRSSGSIS